MTIYKLLTWWRIQKRMLSIYWELFLYYLLWPVRLTVNIVLFLTIPVWLAPFYMGIMVYRAWESKKNVEHDVLTGKIWLHDMFRIY